MRKQEYHMTIHSCNYKMPICVLDMKWLEAYSIL